MTYPVAMRATGLGWALGVGRVGSIVGPTIIGLMLASAADARSVYLWCLAPILFGMVAVALLKRRAAPAPQPVTVELRRRTRVAQRSRFQTHRDRRGVRHEGPHSRIPRAARAQGLERHRLQQPDGLLLQNPSERTRAVSERLQDLGARRIDHMNATGMTCRSCR